VCITSKLILNIGHNNFRQNLLRGCILQCCEVLKLSYFFSCCFVNPHFVALVNKKTKQRLLFSLVPKFFCFQSCTVWKRKFAQFCYFESFFFLWKQNTLTCVSWHLIILLHRLKKIKKKDSIKVGCRWNCIKKKLNKLSFYTRFCLLNSEKQKAKKRFAFTSQYEY